MREEIRAGIVRCDSDAEIARRIEVHRCTVGREVRAGGGRDAYRAFRAQDRADRAALRPRGRWVESRPQLWSTVVGLLAARWSPEQIAGHLRNSHPGAPEWWVSHESIHQAIFVQAKPELRAELVRSLT